MSAGCWGWANLAKCLHLAGNFGMGCTVAGADCIGAVGGTMGSRRVGRIAGIGVGGTWADRNLGSGMSEDMAGRS